MGKESGGSILLHIFLSTFHESIWSLMNSQRASEVNELLGYCNPSVAGRARRSANRRSSACNLYPSAFAWTSHHPRSHACVSLVASRAPAIAFTPSPALKVIKMKRHWRETDCNRKSIWMHNANCLLSWHIQYADCLSPPPPSLKISHDSIRC